MQHNSAIVGSEKMFVTCDHELFKRLTSKNATLAKEDKIITNTIKNDSCLKVLNIVFFKFKLMLISSEFRGSPLQRKVWSG
jgi:hypothetical protein